MCILGPYSLLRQTLSATRALALRVQRQRCSNPCHRLGGCRAQVLYSRSSGGCGPSADHAPPETLGQDPSCVLLLLVVVAALGLRLRDSMSAFRGPGSRVGLSAPMSKVPLLSGHQSLPRAHPDHICRGRHSQLAGLRGCPRLCGRTQFLLQSANSVGLQ